MFYVKRWPFLGTEVGILVLSKFLLVFTTFFTWIQVWLQNQRSCHVDSTGPYFLRCICDIFYFIYQMRRLILYDIDVSAVRGTWQPSVIVLKYMYMTWKINTFWSWFCGRHETALTPGLSFKRPALQVDPENQWICEIPRTINYKELLINRRWIKL